MMMRPLSNNWDVFGQQQKQQQGNDTTDLIHDDGAIICLCAEERKAANRSGHAEVRVCFHHILSSMWLARPPISSPGTRCADLEENRDAMERAANVTAGALSIEHRGSFQHKVIGRDGYNRPEV